MRRGDYPAAARCGMLHGIREVQGPRQMQPTPQPLAQRRRRLATPRPREA
ncbi:MULTISPECIES: hypothetical protein [unclassified Pseudomonas]|nr:MULTISPECIES: hypothetical protein [unclassified Pseudomonas]MDH0893588.1 hypothetical protein [Pseudomonas sp. GD03875]MDH1065761.1 hypothetical protein [Pseudomonas sp. GD03985]